MEGDSALQIKAPSTLRVPRRALLNYEEGDDDSTLVRSERRPKEEDSPFQPTKFLKPLPEIVSDSSSARKSEDGILKFPLKLRITTLFESVPVWLLSLTKEYVSEISFPQVSSFSALRDLILSNKAPTEIYDPMVNFLGQSLFRFGKETSNGDLVLVSSNMSYLF